MLNALIRWSLSNRLAILIVSVLLLFGGGYVATRMPVDVFPDLTAPTVTIRHVARSRKTRPDRPGCPLWP